MARKLKEIRVKNELCIEIQPKQLITFIYDE